MKSQATSNLIWIPLMKKNSMTVQDPVEMDIMTQVRWPG